VHGDRAHRITVQEDTTPIARKVHIGQPVAVYGLHNRELAARGRFHRLQLPVAATVQPYELRTAREIHFAHIATE
jgi:hypothetical protein